MIRKTLNRVVSLLKNDWSELPRETRNEFERAVLNSNITRFRIVLIFLLFCLLPVFTVDYINYTAGLWSVMSGYRYLSYTHAALLILLIAQVVIVYSLHIDSERRAKLMHRVLINAMFFTQLLVTAVVSIVDQMIHGEITSYIIGCVFVAVIALAEPKVSFLAYLLSFAGFIVGISITQTDWATLQAHYVNGALLVAISWIISVLFYRNVFNQFLTKKKLEDLANIDYLTGCLNRRALISRLEHELSRAKRERKTTAILLIDIDLFKQVNDKYGHLFGDYVLKQIVMILNKCCREYDFIGRLGGEEFIMCLPNTSSEDASEAAERLRCVIRDTEMTYQFNKVKITVSLGVAALECDCHETIDALISKADQAMYRAKKTRDQVCMYSRMNDPIRGS